MSDACPKCGLPYSPERLGACPQCLLEGDLPPALVGENLELHEEIGRGGMGTVFKARHLRLNRTVAVKFLPEELAQQPEFQARFEREAQALAMLNHPCIVSVYDFGQTEGQSYIVMEFVQGKALSDLLPLPTDDAIRIAIQVCDALSAAHKKGVIHRDLKPENILIDEEGNAKVTDFGIARIVHPNRPRSTVTTPDVTLGTPHYMAPEALQGARPDPRMDIYSLGIVLHQMLTGRLPVAELDIHDGAFRRLLKKTLAADPQARYASAEEVRRDLLRLQNRKATGELDTEEKNWVRAVALLQAIATAVALFALWISITPKVIEPQEVRPLIMLATEKLPDGRLVSHARFEIWPTLAAVATLILAIAATTLLRRHWRRSGLESVSPHHRIPQSTWVLGIGALCIAVWAARKWLQSREILWGTTYVPVCGGFLLLVVLYLFWIVVLEARRKSRPLSRELFLWSGMFLALIPPVVEFLLYMNSWRP